MQKTSSLLFAGTHFDKKRFAKDIARFKTNEEQEECHEIEYKESQLIEMSGSKKEKKRKRKDLGEFTPSKKLCLCNSRMLFPCIFTYFFSLYLVSIEIIEGFSIFKSLKSLKTKDVTTIMEDDSVLHRKKIEQQIELDSLFRKKYGIHISGYSVRSPLRSFDELKSRFGCKSRLLGNIFELRFKEPTPIQRQVIPILLSGRECFACAPTGSGKTLAFVIPMLMKIKPGCKGIKGVIICPTRELAAQTTRECKKVAKGKKLRIKLMTKELSRCGDFEKMSCDILVSTPLRVDFALRERKLNLSWVEYLVLDESDKLFELGFVEQIDSIVKACSNPSIVRSLFSATLPDSVEELARTIMHDAVRVIVGRKNSASALVKQRLLFAGSEKGKLLALRLSFAESLNPPVLVFVQSKERAKELYKELAFDDIKPDVIHADLTQQQREDAVDNFRAGKSWVLIATDVIARGMDFKGINCVINYDFPESAAAYIHRIGRSGRAGRSGEAITLFTEEDKPFLRNIANVMRDSGCEVPAWILSLPKLKRKKHRPRRYSVGAEPDDTEQ